MGDLSVHQLAEKFLREYLGENGGTTRVSVVSTRARVIETRDVAEAFVNQLRKARREAEAQEATRYEIEAAQQVTLFTFVHHLAQTINLEELPAWQDELQKCGIDATPLPAPEVHRGSL
jgi:ABC-type nitrate/sulfonate/bicarbonate transport system substrate-binding protein